MGEFKEVLTLPVDDLKERRKLLESELEKVIVKDITTELKEVIGDVLKKTDIKLERVSWEFHPESDDEGGVDYWPSYVQVFASTGEIEEDSDESIEIKVKSEYSDYVYTYDLFEFITEQLHEHSSDLYEYDIEEILF